MSTVIDIASTARDISDVGSLFRDYATWLAQDHAVPRAGLGIDAELADMPGIYGPPWGRLLLARTADGRAVACVALRPFDRETGEIKRLYVRPEGRGQALGVTFSIFMPISDI